MDLDVGTDLEPNPPTPPKSSSRTNAFPDLFVSPRNLRITVVPPKTTPKKRAPLSPIQKFHASTKPKIHKFTLADRRNAKATKPMPAFNVYVDPDLRPVPKR